MTSEPVTKPIAIGLKEIGFDSPVVVYYEDSDDKIHGIYSSSVCDFNHREGYEDCYSAPTIDECVNYLLDKHGIYVEVGRSRLSRYWNACLILCIDGNVGEVLPYKLSIHDTRTQALTAGIEAAIVHIKNKMKDGK